MIHHSYKYFFMFTHQPLHPSTIKYILVWDGLYVRHGRWSWPMNILVDRYYSGRYIHRCPVLYLCTSLGNSAQTEFGPLHLAGR